MHKVRRQAKFAAWYTDPDEAPSAIPIKNPFAKYRPPRTSDTLSDESEDRPGPLGRSSPIKAYHSSVTSTTGTIPPYIVVDDADAAAKPSSGPHLRAASKAGLYEPHGTTSDKAQFATRIFNLPFWRSRSSEDEGPEVSGKRSKAAADAISNANVAYMARVKQNSRGFVADFLLDSLRSGEAKPFSLWSGFVIDTRLDTTVPQTQKISSINSFRASFEKQPNQPSIRVIYILDDEPLAQIAIEQYFQNTTGDTNWQRFRAWATRAHIVRSAAHKINRWCSTRNRVQFAFGIDHCDRFIPADEKSSGEGLLEVVSSVMRRGVYDQTYFSKCTQVPRSEVYYSSSTVGEKGSRTSHTVIVKQARPCHYKQLDTFPRTWDDPSILSSFLAAEKDLASSKGDNVQSFRLLRTLLSSIMTETNETWNARTVALDRELDRLETQVYQHPADDAPSCDLWDLSRYLLEMQQMMGHHLGMMQWVQHTVNAAAQIHMEDSTPEDKAAWESLKPDWLDAQMRELQESAQNIEDNFVKPIDHMLDRMYKSVSIRDARRSLELNASLWRLSWITFIFLPLTFLVGFFGMNVDTFNNHPSLKWYFVAAVPFMALILLTWFAFKHCFSHRKVWEDSGSSMLVRKQY